MTQRQRQGEEEEEEERKETPQHFSPSPSLLAPGICDDVYRSTTCNHYKPSCLPPTLHKCIDKWVFDLAERPVVNWDVL